MSLLTKQKRSTYLKALGYSGYSTANVLAFQKRAFIDPKEHDGRYGNKTDIALRHFYNVLKNCNHDNFRAEEFKCPCGRCTGYPTWMKANELKNVQAIRDHYKQPMTITSALRCKEHNKAVGGVEHSKHLEGRAVDFYAPSVTDSLARRKTAIMWMKKLKKFNYAYCNGYNSYGENVHKPQMGTSIHIESKA